MHRAVALADREPLRGGNCLADIDLGFARGGDEIEALGETGGDGGRKRAAGAVSVFRGDARGREACVRGRP